MAVVFDLDGTLIDSAPDIHAAALKMLAAAGLPTITEAQTHSFVGNGVPMLVSRIMAAVGLAQAPERHSDLVASFLSFYEADPAAHTTIYPGVEKALDDLAQRGQALAVCTNKPERPARAILSVLGLADRFDLVIGGDTLPVRKPDPAPLRLAMEGLGADSCLFVGDSEIDAATAQACGVPFALYSQGYHRSPVEQIPHDHLFGHFDRLPDIAARVLPRAPA